MENETEEVARVGASGAVDLQSGTSGKPQGSGACTRMKGFTVMSLLDSIAVPGRIEPTTLAAVLQLRKLEFEKFQVALDGMHQVTAIVAETKRRRGRTSRNTSAPLAQFEPGYFALYMDVWAGPPAKLRMRWKGPAMVVKANSPWVFEIQNLITGLVKEAHASRLKFYADRDLEVSADLLPHVAHNGQGYEVEEFGDARWNEVKQVYEIAVKWRGLDDVETSWEPAQNLFEDLPGPLTKYLKTRMGDPVFHAMCERYDWLLPQERSVARVAPSGQGRDGFVDKTSTTYPDHR
jgi:hypothetical protein